MRDLAQVEALAELLIFDDAEFVERAYAAIHGRQPEAHERNHCLERLLNGTSKDTILTELASLKNDRASASKTRDASALLRRQRTPRMPIHGAISQPVTDALRALNSSINAKADDQQKLLVQINQTLSALSRAAARMPSMAATGPVDATHDTTQTNPHVLQEHLSPYARDILQQLDSASIYFARNNA